MLNQKTKNRLLNRLRPRTTTPFRHLGDVTETVHGPMIFQDNGADILAVGHLDYVAYQKPRIEGDIVRCTQLDDRLGVWVLLDVLPRLGLKFDVLLTDSEELGQSTAQFFDPPKEYRWLFEFDRAGSDSVMYDYETPEYAELLESYGWKVGCGSFSDISYLEHLGVAGFNLGTGYHSAHTQQCYANLVETAESLNRFCRMYDDQKDVRMPHVPRPQWRPLDYRDDSYSRYAAANIADDDEACQCGSDQLWYQGAWYCPACDYSHITRFLDDVRWSYQQ